jgi:hypothetical protein
MATNCVEALRVWVDRAAQQTDLTNNDVDAVRALGRRLPHDAKNLAASRHLDHPDRPTGQ